VHCGCEMTNQMKHEPSCQMKGTNHSDAARRLADTYNLHRIALGDDAIGKWFAAALSDGDGDQTLYDSKLECVRHQKHNEQYYTFIKIVPPGMKICEAEIMLATARRMYDAGMRMTDPDHKHGGPDLIKRLTASDQLAQMRGAVTNLKMPWEA
jgi:hypothetical protein